MVVCCHSNGPGCVGSDCLWGGSGLAAKPILGGRCGFNGLCDILGTEGGWKMIDIKILEAAGLSTEQIVSVLKAVQAAEAERKANTRELSRQRSKRYRERIRNEINDGVTSVTRDDSDAPPLLMVSPIPSSLTTPQESKKVSKKETARQAAPGVRGTRLPINWEPGVAELALGEKLELSPTQIGAIAEEFRDYWVGVPGARGTKLDWGATFRNRLRAKQERSNAKVLPFESSKEINRKRWRDALDKLGKFAEGGDVCETPLRLLSGAGSGQS